MSARIHVAGVLRERLPKTWRVIDSEIGQDVPDRITVRISNQRIRRAPSNPQGGYVGTLTIHLVSNLTDHGRAEEQLEDALDVLLDVIEDNFALPWEEASKVLLQETQTLAWEIPLPVHLTRTEG